MKNVKVTITVEVPDQPVKVLEATAASNGNPAFAARGLLNGLREDAGEWLFQVGKSRR